MGQAIGSHSIHAVFWSFECIESESAISSTCNRRFDKSKNCACTGVDDFLKIQSIG